MKALFILVGLLSTAIALLCAGGLSPAKQEALAAGSACGFAILGGLCFVAYALLVMAARIKEAAELEREQD